MSQRQQSNPEIEPIDDEEGEEFEIIDENFDPNYIPSEEELLQYAYHLGMSLPQDRDLLWIAQKGLTTPLPEPWKMCQNKSGEILYVNLETGETMEEFPLEEYFRELYQQEKQKLIHSAQQALRNQRTPGQADSKSSPNKKSPELIPKQQNISHLTPHSENSRQNRSNTSSKREAHSAMMEERKESEENNFNSIVENATNSLTNSNEPSEMEVLAYAKLIGMQIPQDRDLLWIASEMIKTPLPDDWEAYYNGDKLVYVHQPSGEMQDEDPLLPYFKEIYEQEKYKRDHGEQDGEGEAIAVYHDEELGELIPLDENIPENYEPTQEEIIQYAEYLGMNPEEDEGLFWIAKEALKSRLPSEWRACAAQDGNVFYVNTVSNAVQAEHPLDAQFYKKYVQEKAKLKGVDPESIVGASGKSAEYASGTMSHEYQPTEEELLNYAEYIGIKLPEDNDLLWIAKEGLTAPLPAEWRACETEHGDLCFQNVNSGEVVMEHPLDEQYKKIVIQERAKLENRKSSLTLKHKLRTIEEEEENREKQVPFNLLDHIDDSQALTSGRIKNNTGRSFTRGKSEPESLNLIKTARSDVSKGEPGPEDQVLSTDSNYEPEEEEILTYAQYLGMKLPEDRDFLWIAKEGLKAPLPKPWKPCATKDQSIYYMNPETGETVWEHPLDEVFRLKFKEEKKKARAAEFSSSAIENSNERGISRHIENMDESVQSLKSDHDYQPTREEIYEYGHFLGLEFPDDEDLLYIAEEGIKAPPPKEWKTMETKKGEIFYYNTITKDSIWDHPLDEHYRSVVKREKAKKAELENQKKEEILEDEHNEEPQDNNSEGEEYYKSSDTAQEILDALTRRVDTQGSGKLARIDEMEGLGSYSDRDDWLPDESSIAPEEPSQDAVLRCAGSLGIDIVNDNHLLWIAKERLKAPLPENWRAFTNRSGEKLFMNSETKEVSKVNPNHAVYAQLYKDKKAEKEPANPEASKAEASISQGEQAHRSHNLPEIDTNLDAQKATIRTPSSHSSPKKSDSNKNLLELEPSPIVQQPSHMTDDNIVEEIEEIKKEEEEFVNSFVKDLPKDNRQNHHETSGSLLDSHRFQDPQHGHLRESPGRNYELEEIKIDETEGLIDPMKQTIDVDDLPRKTNQEKRTSASKRNRRMSDESEGKASDNKDLEGWSVTPEDSATICSKNFQSDQEENDEPDTQPENSNKEAFKKRSSQKIKRSTYEEFKEQQESQATSEDPMTSVPDYMRSDENSPKSSINFMKKVRYNGEEEDIEPIYMNRQDSEDPNAATKSQEPVYQNMQPQDEDQGEEVEIEIIENPQDENFEPSLKAILGYASMLGMKVPEDLDLLWIAREGLKAGMPEGWKLAKVKGEIMFLNLNTNEITNEDPTEKLFKEAYMHYKSEKHKSLAEGRLPEGNLIGRSFSGCQITEEEEIDDDYIPSEEEVIEYAKSLGYELPEDEDLLWIARDGLCAYLPPTWKPCLTPDGAIFYLSLESGMTMWDHPRDSEDKRLFLQEKELKLLEQQREMVQAPKDEDMLTDAATKGSRRPAEEELSDLRESNQDEKSNAEDKSSDSSQTSDPRDGGKDDLDEYMDSLDKKNDAETGNIVHHPYQQEAPEIVTPEEDSPLFVTQQPIEFNSEGLKIVSHEPRESERPYTIDMKASISSEEQQSPSKNLDKPSREDTPNPVYAEEPKPQGTFTTQLEPEDLHDTSQNHKKDVHNNSKDASMRYDEIVDISEQDSISSNEKNDSGPEFINRPVEIKTSKLGQYDEELELSDTKTIPSLSDTSPLIKNKLVEAAASLQPDPEIAFKKKPQPENTIAHTSQELIPSTLRQEPDVNSNTLIAPASHVEEGLFAPKLSQLRSRGMTAEYPDDFEPESPKSGAIKPVEVLPENSKVNKFLSRGMTVDYPDDFEPESPLDKKLSDIESVKSDKLNTPGRSGIKSANKRSPQEDNYSDDFEEDSAKPSISKIASPAPESVDEHIEVQSLSNFGTGSRKVSTYNQEVIEEEPLARLMHAPSTYIHDIDELIEEEPLAKLMHAPSTVIEEPHPEPNPVKYMDHRPIIEQDEEYESSQDQRSSIQNHSEILKSQFSDNNIGKSQNSDLLARSQLSDNLAKSQQESDNSPSKRSQELTYNKGGFIKQDSAELSLQENLKDTTFMTKKTGPMDTSANIQGEMQESTVNHFLRDSIFQANLSEITSETKNSARPEARAVSPDTNFQKSNDLETINLEDSQESSKRLQNVPLEQQRFIPVDNQKPVVAKSPSSKGMNIDDFPSVASEEGEEDNSLDVNIDTRVDLMQSSISTEVKLELPPSDFNKSGVKSQTSPSSMTKSQKLENLTLPEVPEPSSKRGSPEPKTYLKPFSAITAESQLPVAPVVETTQIESKIASKPFDVKAKSLKRLDSSSQKDVDSPSRSNLDESKGESPTTLRNSFKSDDPKSPLKTEAAQVIIEEPREEDKPKEQIKPAEIVPQIIEAQPMPEEKIEKVINQISSQVPSQNQSPSSIKLESLQPQPLVQNYITQQRVEPPSNEGSRLSSARQSPLKNPELIYHKAILVDLLNRFKGEFNTLKNTVSATDTGIQAYVSKNYTEYTNDNFIQYINQLENISSKLSLSLKDNYTKISAALDIGYIQGLVKQGFQSAYEQLLEYSTIDISRRNCYSVDEISKILQNLLKFNEIFTDPRQIMTYVQISESSLYRAVVEGKDIVLTEALTLKVDALCKEVDATAHKIPLLDGSALLAKIRTIMYSENLRPSLENSSAVLMLNLLNNRKAVGTRIARIFQEVLPNGLNLTPELEDLRKEILNEYHNFKVAFNVFQTEDFIQKILSGEISEASIKNIDAISDDRVFDLENLLSNAEKMSEMLNEVRIKIKAFDDSAREIVDTSMSQIALKLKLMITDIEGPRVPLQKVILQLLAELSTHLTKGRIAYTTSLSHIKDLNINLKKVDDILLSSRSRVSASDGFNSAKYRSQSGTSRQEANFNSSTSVNPMSWLGSNYKSPTKKIGDYSTLLIKDLYTSRESTAKSVRSPF